MTFTIEAEDLAPTSPSPLQSLRHTFSWLNLPAEPGSIL